MHPQPSQSPIAQKAWLTAHTRIQSESRYRTYETTSYLLTAYYALWLIVFSVLQRNSIIDIPHFGELSIVLSVIILVLTIILYGFKFGHKADAFRSCYLRLQELYNKYNNSTKHQDIAEEYSDILLHYPNHSDSDFYAFIVREHLYKTGLSP